MQGMLGGEALELIWLTAKHVFNSPIGQRRSPWARSPCPRRRNRSSALPTPSHGPATLVRIGSVQNTVNTACHVITYNTHLNCGRQKVCILEATSCMMCHCNNNSTTHPPGMHSRWLSTCTTTRRPSRWRTPTAALFGGQLTFSSFNRVHRESSWSWTCAGSGSPSRSAQRSTLLPPCRVPSGKNKEQHCGGALENVGPPATKRSEHSEIHDYLIESPHLLTFHTAGPQLPP